MNFDIQISTRCGYEVLGMIILQVYLYTCSLLRGITFEILPLNGYALSPMMLPLLKHPVVTFFF